VINRTALLSDLQTMLRKLEADLLERSEARPEVLEALAQEHQRAREAERTAQSYEAWRADASTQMAAAWVLSGVFARFLEDNRLVEPPQIAGPGERLARARDEHELYFRAHPTETDREYLLHVFGALATLPGAQDIFGAYNPIYALPHWLSGDAAGALLQFFQRIDANTGALVHDFTDPEWNTRFLGDLYQDLSEATRKQYALLQTPEFVEAFMLDRTLDPAIEEFGLAGLRVLDPTCGSGHFLLGALQRLLEQWLQVEPGMVKREVVQRALEAVYGVDVNPYAVAIARFRLLVAALQASGITKLREAPGFRINVAVGNSLLHGRRLSELGLTNETVDLRRVGGSQHVYRAEDLVELHRILGQQYHVVVGNPPYITVKDQALNKAYRQRFSTCHRQYSLAVPFTERFFDLALYGHNTMPAGYVGMITANSFMKREFGTKLIEEFLPHIDLTHVIDTSGAYIPGHGTPTVMLFGRHRAPVSREVRAVLGIRGEPRTPDDPAQGLVWRSIVEHLDQVGSQNEFVSVTDISRETFSKHPWGLGGGGAASLRNLLEETGERTLLEIGADIGFLAITGEDNCLLLEHEVPRRYGFTHVMPLGYGEVVRDWSCGTTSVVIWPNSATGERLQWHDIAKLLTFLWPYRTSLKNRKAFGVPIEDKGIPWWALRELYTQRLKTPLAIAYAEVATHNHFVLDRGGKVFSRTAPVIKLPASASAHDHLRLVGVLNSSTACFWLRQVCHDKGGGGIGGGIATETWEHFFVFNATNLEKFPLPPEDSIELAYRLDQLAREYCDTLPAAQLSKEANQMLSCDQNSAAAMRTAMIALQEELDWHCYHLYHLLDGDLTYGKEPPSIALGQRAFEIVMARKMAAGELETTWFERHGSTPLTELPAAWPEDYRTLVERRIALIETDRNIGLIEQPEYKRRWNTEAWASQRERALRNWLLDRLESYFDCDGRMNDAGQPTARIDIALMSTAQLADMAQQDADFMQVGACYRDDPAFDVARLVAELVEAESVPLLPVLRYKASGLRQRAAWEQTWDMQRHEDAIDTRTRLSQDDPQYLTEVQAHDLKRCEIGTIPVPPRYTSSDFASSTSWRLRGKLDVPKERWISFPYCEGNDGTLLIAWAGYDHLQLARAISAYYVDIQEHLGGHDDPRLVPLLACLIELLPWLKQWHNDVDPEFGLHMGDYFAGFIQEEARQMGKTRDQIMAWKPPKTAARRRQPAARSS
jgi:SAM-dependent methyltransferase